MEPKALTDLSVKVAAENLSYETIEERLRVVPEHIQQRLAFWSFPSVEDLHMYSLIDEVPTFRSAQRLVNSNSLMNVTQIGFLLQGQIEFSEARKHTASLTFDRCKVTSLKCTCQGVGKEEHKQVARIQKPDEVSTRLCISEQTDKLDNIQMKKLLHHLLNQNMHFIPKAQSLLDELFQSNSETCLSNGVPDVKAGAFDRCEDNKNKKIFACEHVIALAIYRIQKPDKVSIRQCISEQIDKLDNIQLKELLHHLLNNIPHLIQTAQSLLDDLSQPNSDICLSNGIADVTAGAALGQAAPWYLNESALRSSVSHAWTSNVLRFSRLNKFLDSIENMLKVRHTNGFRILKIITEVLVRKCTTITDDPHFWNRLGSLWLSVVINPDSSQKERDEWHSLMEEWSRDPSCSTEMETPFPQQSKTVTQVLFQKALDAIHVTWDNHILKSIINEQGFENQTLWLEDLHTAFARVDALSCFGYNKKAMLLSKSIALSIVKKEVDAVYCRQLKELMCHVGNPVGRLCEILMPNLHSIINFGHFFFDEETALTNIVEPSCDDNLEICLEVALIFLCYPLRIQVFEKTVLSHQEDLRFLLNKITINDKLLKIVEKHTKWLLTEKPMRSHLYLPRLHLGCYLFSALKFHDNQLAFEIGLHILRQSIEAIKKTTINTERLNDLQYELASLMLSATTPNLIFGNLNEGHSFETIINILLEKKLCPPSCAEKFLRGLDAHLKNDTCKPFQKIVYEFGVNLCRLSLTSKENVDRGLFTRLLVPLSFKAGFHTVHTLLQYWSVFFKPHEILNYVAEQVKRHCVKSCRDWVWTPIQAEKISIKMLGIVVDCMHENIEKYAVDGLRACSDSQLALQNALTVVKENAVKLKIKDVLYIEKFLKAKGYSQQAHQLK